MRTESYARFRGLMARGAASEAVRLADAELAAEGGRSEFWLTQLSLALSRARQHDRAIEAADRALALKPRSAFALLARADAVRAGGRAREALANYEEVLGLGEARAVQRAARGALECLCELGEWARVLEAAPSWLPPGEGARWRVRALAGLGRPDEAVAACEEWLREKPDQPEALWELTALEVERDGLEAVLGRMARIAKIPTRPPIYREIYASLCRRAGREDEAAAQYRKLAAAAPEPRILKKQAFTLAKNGQEEEAIPLMEELLRLDPTDPYLHSAYAAACERVGRLEQAWSFCHSLIAQHPEQKKLFGRLRRIRERMEKAHHPEEAK